MPTAAINHHDQGDPVLDDFAAFTRKKGVFSHPSIKAHRFPGRGFGILALKDILPNTKIIHVPTKAILQWKSVPEDFMRVERGQDVRVHARLAAYLALGGVEVEAKYGPWMKTWPKLDDFKLGMVGLWPEATRGVCRGESRGKKGGARGGKRRKTREENYFTLLPPGITGTWITLQSSPSHKSNGLETGSSDSKPPPSVNGILGSQLSKFHGDLLAASRHFPVLRHKDSEEHARFLWAWCCVNTRSFYYWPAWLTKEKPPEDRDEAMVLCPGMEFFNHNPDTKIECSVKYDRSGYTVRVNQERTIEAGEELYLSYGPHTEEYLMVEYGFLLGGIDGANDCDNLCLDDVIFNSLNEEQQNALKQVGYDGQYTLRTEGVCWRTQVAARLTVMERKEWMKFVECELIDHQDGMISEKTPGDDQEGWKETPVRMAGRVIVTWILQVRREAENSLRGLLSLTNDDIFRTFGNNFQRMAEEKQKQERTFAEIRFERVVRRWKQILQMCLDASWALEEECPGTHLTGETGRTREAVEIREVELRALLDSR